MLEYIKILFAPFGLYMGHDYQMFSITEPRAIAGGIIVLAMLIYGIKVRRSNQLVFFSIFWFFITLGPVSNLYPIAFFMADHYLYLPSIGFFLILAKLLESLYKKSGIFRVYSISIFVVFAGFLGYRQIQQNDYWSDAKKFYERTLEYNPSSPRMWSNLAKENIRLDNREEAIKLYKKAIEIDPRFVNAHYNLGAVYNTLGRYDEAIASCEKAIEIEPMYTHAYNIIGAVYMNQGKNEEALKYFKMAVSTSPSNVIALCNLAVANSKTGNNEEAIRLLNTAIEANPDYPLAYSNLGYVYSLAGRRSEALVAFKTAIEMNPNDANTINNLGKAYYDSGQVDKAMEAFSRALEIKPDHRDANANLRMLKQMAAQESIADPFRVNLQGINGDQSGSKIGRNNNGGQ